MSVERPSGHLVSETAGATFGGLIGLWAGTAIGGPDGAEVGSVVGAADSVGGRNTHASCDSATVVEAGVCSVPELRWQGFADVVGSFLAA